MSKQFDWLLERLQKKAENGYDMDSIMIVVEHHIPVLEKLKATLP